MYNNFLDIVAKMGNLDMDDARYIAEYQIKLWRESAGYNDSESASQDYFNLSVWKDVHKVISNRLGVEPEEGLYGESTP